jgi:hypothetical protein
MYAADPSDAHFHTLTAPRGARQRTVLKTVTLFVGEYGSTPLEE